MAINYTKDKNKIKFSEIENKNFSLSSQQYKEVLIDPNNSKTVKELLVDKIQSGKEVGSDAYVDYSDFIYIRTKGFGKKLYNLDLDVKDSHSFIKPNDFKKNVGANNMRQAKEGDILFATGGDLGNVCYVSKPLQNNIISSHIIKLNFGSLQKYCLAIFKTNLIKEQVSLSPSGGIKGLDSFSIDYLLESRIPMPVNNKENIIEYISHLSSMNIILEDALDEKIKSANKFISEELNNNQRIKAFCFKQPKISEIFEIGRLDTLRYSPIHKKTRFLIENYSNGSCSLSDLGYIFQRGQNLQISSIGLSIYSDVYKQNFYSLIFSKNFTKYCTYSCEEFLGNKLKLSELNKGDIVFSSRGDYGRVTIVLDDVQKTITNIDNIIIKNKKKNIERDIAVCLVLNWYREIGFMRTIGFVGSGADSLTQNQIDNIPIPKFSPSMIKNISSFYYTGYKIDCLDEISIKNLIANGGIKDIDDIRKLIRNRIDESINKIIEKKDIEISLNI